MKIYFNLEHAGDKLTNFRIAEEIVNICNERYELNAEAIAKMILIQIDAKKSEEIK